MFESRVWGWTVVEPQSAGTDNTLTAAYIAAFVAFALFALDRLASLYTRWRDRERDGIEILVEGLSIASLAIVREKKSDLPDVHAELGLVGMRVQMRIRRRRRTIGALIQFVLYTAARSRDRTEFSEAARVHIISSLYSTFGDELVRWHSFRTSAGAMKKVLVELTVVPRDKETGLTDAEQLRAAERQKFRGSGGTT
jgi:hypothetical protein